MEKIIQHLSKDPRLVKIIKQVGEPNLRVDPNHFRALIESIISQQLSIKASDAIFAKFLELFINNSCHAEFSSASPFYSSIKILKPVQDDNGEISNRLLLVQQKKSGDYFPSPHEVARMPAQHLRAVGLSEKKVIYIHALAMSIIDGDLNFSAMKDMSDEEVIAELIKLPGIGPWTSHMFLIFSFQREDVWPIGDLGIRKAIMKLDNLDTIPSEKEILNRADVWKPYRTYASWYLWRL